LGHPVVGTYICVGIYLDWAKFQLDPTKKRSFPIDPIVKKYKSNFFSVMLLPKVIDFHNGGNGKTIHFVGWN